jgi:hypothetical protein
METLRNASLFALLALLLAIVPLGMALVYAIRPTERNLALMRPLSLTGLFSALAGTVLGFLNVLRGIGIAQELTADYFRRMAIGAAESLCWREGRAA